MRSRPELMAHHTRKPVVVIHTNDQQMVAAIVSAHSLKSRSTAPERFDVRILRLEDTPQLYDRERQSFKWWEGTGPSVWRRRDLQSFAPLRRLVPEWLGFAGRALVIDPDVFAVGDVQGLLFRDMGDKAILCRRKTEFYEGRQLYSSAVMLLDCTKLGDWDWEHDIDELFSFNLTLGPWLALLDVPPTSIGLFEEEWNHLDTLTNRTRLLHFTETSTQPWKTGLRADYHRYAPRGPACFEGLRHRGTQLRWRRTIRPALYQPHPDPRQEQLFFNLLTECLEQGTIDEEFLKTAIGRKHLRKDALAIVERLRRRPPQGPT
jgi:hypothetical protein